MICGSHYKVAFTADVSIDVLKSKRKRRCPKQVIFSDQSNGAKQETFSFSETPFLKPVQPHVQAGPVKTTFVVNILWQGSNFFLQLVMLWKEG